MQPLPQASRRDFVDVMWMIAEKRCCDEVAVRYDCGHAIRVDVWIPVLPKTSEYANQEADRRRFMQHSIFVLTKNPGSPKVQVTVPEGRCRHCGRGQRQALICGLLQMDLVEAAAAQAGASQAALAKGGGRGQAVQAVPAAALAASAARRLELPLSSHVFLAAMGQVCRLPDNITPPPLLQSSSALQGGALKPSEGPPLSQAGLHQWSRKEIEDELKAEVVKYVGGATFLLVFVVIECLYLCFIHFGPSSRDGGGPAAAVSRSVSGELGSLASVGAIEMGISNSTWVLSALTLAVHKAFGPGDAAGLEGSMWWSMIVHPLWILVSILLAPLLWVLDLMVAVPRFLLLHVVFVLIHSLLSRMQPCSWILGGISEGFSACVSFLFKGIFTRPTIMLSQIPMTNPMVVALVLSLLVAAFSAPQLPSLSFPSIWSDFPNLELGQRLESLCGPVWKEGRPKGSRQGAPAAKGQKDKAQKEKGGADQPSSRPDKVQEGRQKGAAQSAPACVVCLDRPSRYILEPCGHKVVCGECAVQLVEGAAKNRQAVEVLGPSHHSSEKRGGACPSCGMAITRAMRVFSSPATSSSFSAGCRTGGGNAGPPPRGWGSGARR